MNLLTLFNGLSGLHLACDVAGIKVDNCYYAEIDKYANLVTAKHYPNDVALGDVTKWREWGIDWSSIDLVSAGFPCQAWSVAGQQLGDKDERGMLFWTTLEIIREVLKHNPKAKFLMENVKMKKEFEEYITHHTTEALGYVEKTLINSALVSAQNRNRYYWTNFKVTQPEDKGILLRDILEDGENDREKPQTILATIYKENAKSMVQRGKVGLIAKVGNANPSSNGNCLIKGGAIRGRYNKDGTTTQRLECNEQEKTNALTTVQKDNVVVYNTADNKRIKGITEDDRGFRPHQGDVAKSGISECGRILKPTSDKTDTITANHAPKLTIYRPDERKQRTMVPVCESNSVEQNVYNGVLYRKLNPVECERLQTIPDNWTDCVSKTQRYKMIGNGWTIDVIAHILKDMLND